MSEGKQAWSPGRIIILVVVLFALFAVSTLAFVQYLLTRETAPTARKPAQTGMGPTYSLDSFNVNLADQDSRHFLKTTITLELGTPGVAKELEKRQAQVRDIIISILREKTAEELKDGNATVQKLKDEIKSRLNNVLSSGQVTAVYFTEFIVQ
ncbi:MAG: flagellar protein FliL [Bacillota bacterium]|nr:flagellar protein FliL [Bacillota bacterium]MDK2925039.1 flagellar protein FliL [Bacillota bacterium]